MRRIFDAMADAHFVPQDDGSVRFVLPKPDRGYLILTEAEANGAKIFWRPMVRYYAYAWHACVLICLIVPWLGLLLLLTLWLVGIVLIQEIKHRFERKVGKEEGQHDWVCYRQSHSISRPFALWLKYTGRAVAVLCLASFYLPPEIKSVVGPLELSGLFIVAARWDAFFSGMASSPKAKENWAQAARLK